MNSSMLFLSRACVTNTLRCVKLRQLLWMPEKTFTYSHRTLVCGLYNYSNCQVDNRLGICRRGVTSLVNARALLHIMPSLTVIKACNYSTGTSNFSLKNEIFRQYVESLMSEFNELDEKRIQKQISKPEREKLRKLTLVKECYEDLVQKYDELEELKKLETDEEMKELADEEKVLCGQQITDLEESLVELLTPDHREDESDIILEVECGAGGQEAMLFAQSVLEMYQNHAAHRGWEFSLISADTTSLGGIRSALANISGEGVYREMKFEGGVHRVQRVPSTERGGRIHTSTVSVAILPAPKEIDMTINPSELKIDTMAGATSGGQHAQKNETCVRIVHIPSGITVFCSQERSQLQNKKLAMSVLKSRLYNKKLEAERGQITSQRKIQVGQKERSEKIRTYNFPQDRITDHRIGRSMFNIELFMSGGAGLDGMIGELIQESRREDLMELIETFERQTKVKSKTKAGKKL